VPGAFPAQKARDKDYEAVLQRNK